MEKHEINTIIADLAGLYDSLNERWNNDPCATDSYQSFRQTEYCEIYEKLKNANIEKLALGIIANALDEKILTRLRTLLKDNIQLFETKQNRFSTIDFHKVFSLQEEHLFGNKFALIASDKEIIQDYPYPTKQERQMLLKENQKENNLLENERFEYGRTKVWFFKNYYSLINEITTSFISIIESYFPAETMPDEKEKANISESETIETKQNNLPEQPNIEPDMIFRTGKYEKLVTLLEPKLIADKYLNTELDWISVHDNGKTDIKKLVTFLVGLLDNRYFLPGKDPKIKTFFESRYHINIGQNFERKRRESLLDEYKTVFFEYRF